MKTHLGLALKIKPTSKNRLCCAICFFLLCFVSLGVIFGYAELRSHLKLISVGFLNEAQAVSCIIAGWNPFGWQFHPSEIKDKLCAIIPLWLCIYFPFILCNEIVSPLSGFFFARIFFSSVRSFCSSSVFIWLWM